MYELRSSEKTLFKSFLMIWIVVMLLMNTLVLYLTTSNFDSSEIKALLIMGFIEVSSAFYCYEFLVWYIYRMRNNALKKKEKGEKDVLVKKKSKE